MAFQLSRYGTLDQGSGGFKNVEVVVNNRGDTNFFW
jgi:hypothetical protein